jgi:hypothetical protein
LGTIAVRAAERGLPFVLAGGHAVIAHGHRERIVKDADDVIRLALVNKLELDEPSIRDLFLKHGTAELYEKVRRLCGQS